MDFQGPIEKPKELFNIYFGERNLLLRLQELRYHLQVILITLFYHS